MKPSKKFSVRLRYLSHIIRGWLGYLGLFGRLNPPILVVGSQNSGTTALAEALAVHPKIANRSEERVLWDKDFHSKNHDLLKTAEDATPATIRRIRGNFCYFQWLTGKPYVLNKHPENCFRIHYMKKIFPEARLIHIVRDGHAAINSNNKRAVPRPGDKPVPFGGYSRPPGWREWLDRPMLEQFAYMWKESALYAAREGRKYGKDYLEVRYEDLTENAPEVISRIWEWLGLEVTPDTVAQLPSFKNQNYKWKEKLSHDQIRTIRQVAYEGLRYFGYMDVSEIV
jgi:omega-hydroxy-beta-dihydromenaquinone-9 sulfotransferase